MSPRSTDWLVLAQASRVVRAYDRFNSARGLKSRQHRASELEHELRALKRLLEPAAMGRAANG